MPLSEADSRTVLLHLEAIRNIIRGAQPVPGDIRDVAAGFEPPRETPADAEPDLDGGCARQAAETASR